MTYRAEQETRVHRNENAEFPRKKKVLSAIFLADKKKRAYLTLTQDIGQGFSAFLAHFKSPTPYATHLNLAITIQ